MFLYVESPNKDNQPYYIVTGTVPFSPLYWTSEHDRKPTGEKDQFYGHFADSHGNWSGWADPIAAGYWYKCVRDASGKTASCAFVSHGSKPMDIVAGSDVVARDQAEQ